MLLSWPKLAKEILNLNKNIPGKNNDHSTNISKMELFF